MKRIRVAMITQAYLPHVGGAERQLSALIPLLRYRGVQVEIFTRRYPGMSKFEMIAGSPVYRFPVPGPKSVAMLSFVANVVLKLGTLRPDVIHAHELLSPVTAGVVAKKIYGFPVIAKVLRGGTLGDIDKLRRRILGKRRLSHLKQDIDAFVAISSEIDAELDSIGVDAKRRIRIPNGVDTVQFSPVSKDEKQKMRKNLGLPIDVPVAVFAGRLVSEKRVELLLDAWSDVVKEVSAELVVIGSGEEESRLIAKASPRVHYAGQIDNVSSYLQAADVFVLPSATEGLSNAMLEALSVGLGVIVTDVGGAPDVIEDGSNGLLIPPDNKRMLVDALVNLLKNTNLCQRLGDAGRQTIETKYSLESTADQLVNLYIKLIEGRN